MHFATVFFDGDFTFFRPRQLDSPFLFTTPNSSPPTFNAWYTEELCRNWGQHKERILRPTRLDGKEKKQPPDASLAIVIIDRFSTIDTRRDHSVSVIGP